MVIKTKETITMSSGYLRLKVEELIDRGTAEGKAINLHRASQLGGFTYPTMHRYMRQPNGVESMHVRSIVGLLVDALGFTPAQVEAMKFGDIFEVVIDGGKDLEHDGRGRPPA